MSKIKFPALVAYNSIEFYKKVHKETGFFLDWEKIKDIIESENIITRTIAYTSNMIPFMSELRKKYNATVFVGADSYSKLYEFKNDIMQSIVNPDMHTIYIFPHESDLSKIEDNIKEYGASFTIIYSSAYDTLSPNIMKLCNIIDIEDHEDEEGIIYECEKVTA